MLEQEEEGAYVTPCFSSQGINYLHIRHNNLYCTCYFFSPCSWWKGGGGEGGGEEMEVLMRWMTDEEC